MRRRFVETGRDRRDLAAEAGYGRLSLSSVLAGVLVGAGTFGLLAVSAIAVAHRVGWDGELSCRRRPDGSYRFQWLVFDCEAITGRL